MIERWLKEFIFQQHALVITESGIYLLERFGQAVLAICDVILSRIVGSISEPQLKVTDIGLIHDVDAIEEMLDRIGTHLRIWRADRTKDVLIILEGIGINSAELYSQPLRMRCKILVIIDLIPWNMESNSWRSTGVLIDLSCICNFLIRIARHTWLSEDFKART